MKHMETESILQGPMLLILATYILPFISFIIGLYVLILAIWELRIAEKRGNLLLTRFMEFSNVCSSHCNFCFYCFIYNLKAIEAV